MRLSCNGCRVLRKGCSDDCTIRPCLQWIKNPESQANATFFLAKFYGRAGLLNLINSGPDNLRPAIFRSLLYEACGRLVNPVYGSVGLLWTRNWQLCQGAVESVLKGEQVVQTQTDFHSPFADASSFDIRHIAKKTSSSSPVLHKINKKSNRFKRSSSSAAASKKKVAALLPEESLGSGETGEEGSHVSQGEPEEESCTLELELTLGFEPILQVNRTGRFESGKDRDGLGFDANDTCKLGLALKAEA